MTIHPRSTARSAPARARWLPIVAAGAMIVASLAFWWIADQREQRRILQLVDAEADSVASRIDAHLDILVESVERTSLRWGSVDALTPDAAAVESLLLLREPSIGSVLWLEPDLELAWAYGPDASPVPGQVEEWMASIPDPGWQDALDRGRPSVSRALVGPGGARAFLVVVPLALRSGPGGLMVAVVELPVWLRSITAEMGTRLEVSVWPSTLQPDGPTPAAGALRHAASRVIARGDLELQALLWPSNATLAALRSPLPRVVLVGGLVFALLLAVAIRLGQVEGQRMLDARMAAALEREIEARREAESGLADRARALERSNDDLLQFARIISHDLREPLNVVDMHLQLLRGAGQEALDGHVAKALRASGRMVRMIDGLLAYSRVGGGARQRVEVGECVRQAVANLESTVRDAGAAVEIAEMPVVLGNDGQLTLLFQNLIGNAIRHRGDQSLPRIDVLAEPRGEHWLFRVVDNGPGIPAELAERIFELFEGGGAKGSGVGLATCRRLVESVGGRIWVQSQPGEGSTFCFTWPRGNVPPAAQSSEVSSGSPASR